MAPYNRPAPGQRIAAYQNRNKRARAFRAPHHDYTARGFYFITATAYPYVPPLSFIRDSGPELRKGEMIIPVNTDLGDIIDTELRNLSHYHPELKIMRYVIMPDHIHFVVQILDKLSRPLGSELAGFFASCSKGFARLTNQSEVTTLFQPFDDIIIRDYPQLDKTIKYIEENPRRYLIKKKYPELFKTYLNVKIAEYEFAAYGNIFLLKAPQLLPIRIHRRWSEEEFSEYKTLCRRKIADGAIPVTPAIHKVEKEIVNLAVEMGREIILLRDRGFKERFKPQGRQFDLCAAGRLLLLAPWSENLSRRSKSGYTEFHKMNDLATFISSLSAETRFSLRNPTPTP